MIYSAKPLLKNALDPDGAGHTLALPPDDPFIVSCPGSGKTWPRFLPENRLHPQEPATLASIERRVCDAELRLSPYRRCITSPRTIKNFSSALSAGEMSCAIRGNGSEDDCRASTEHRRQLTA